MALYLQRILFRKAPASERESGLCYARGLCRIVLVASVFFIAPFAASAATVLDGVTIAASETWDTAGSPYVIRNEVTIAAGAKLTILPGVVVKFEDDAMLTAEGSIEALGAASEPMAGNKLAVMFGVAMEAGILPFGDSKEMLRLLSKLQSRD